MTLTLDSRSVDYARISQDRTGAGVKVAHQHADNRDLAERLHLPPPHPLQDNDLSAYSGKPRPGYDELLAGLRAGRWNVLIIWHVDRLIRDPRDLEDVVDVVDQHGITVHQVKGGEIDLSTPEGRLQARILGTLARYESEHRSDRVINGAKGTVKRAEAGREHGSARRYGFRCQCAGPHDILKVQPDGTETVKQHVHLDDAAIAAEVAVIKDITDRVVRKESTRGLARELRSRGIPSPRGGEWSARVVKELILRPRNAGLREHQGQIMEDVTTSWDAIIDRDTWDTARAILTNSDRGTWFGNTPAQLLSGIAVCHCGGRIRSGAGGHYVGAGCHHVKRSIRHVDEAVTQFVMKLLARDEIKARTNTSPVVDNRTKLDAVALRIAQIEDALVGDPTVELADISAAGLRRNLVRLQRQLLDLEREQSLSRVPTVLHDVTADNFTSLPLERRRAVVKELATVALLPGRAGNRFDPASVQILPREPAQYSPA